MCQTSNVETVSKAQDNSLEASIWKPLLAWIKVQDWRPGHGKSYSLWYPVVDETGSQFRVSARGLSFKTPWPKHTAQTHPFRTTWVLRDLLSVPVLVESQVEWSKLHKVHELINCDQIVAWKFVVTRFETARLEYGASANDTSSISVHASSCSGQVSLGSEAVLSGSSSLTSVCPSFFASGSLGSTQPGCHGGTGDVGQCAEPGMFYRSRRKPIGLGKVGSF